MALTLDALRGQARDAASEGATATWSSVRRYGELVLWTLLALLSLVLLTYPIRPSLEYQPVQSIGAITNLPVFAALFYAWLALLFSIFLLRTESKGVQVALVVVFTLVSTGPWVRLAWGNSGEAPLYAAQLEHISQTHHFSLDTPNFAYFQFPALFVVASAVSQVTGMTTWDTVVVLVLLGAALMAALLYLTFFNVTGSPKLAWLGVLLVLQGNIIIAKMLSNFHPGAFGFLFYVGFLALVTRSDRPENSLWQNRLLLIILMAGATMAHFVSSVAILTVLAGMALLRWLSGLRQSRPQGSPEPEGRARALLLPGLLLPAVMVAAWEVYQATAVFGSLARLTEQTWRGFVEGEVLTRYAYYRVGSYVERSVLWSLALRYIWLIVGMGLGGLVGLVYLARVRRLAPNQTMAVGGLTGVGLLGLAIALGSSGEDLFRVLFYVPVFTALLLLLGISALGRRIGRYAFAALALLLFVLSFPSLLNNNYTVGFSVYYPTELASGEYLRSSFGQGKTVEVFGGAFPAIYYTPGGDFRFPDPVVVGVARFWIEVQDDVERFKATAAEPNKSGIWILSARTPSNLRHLLGPAGPGDPEYRRLFGKEVPRAGHAIYDNGGVQLFYVGRELH
ncbi:MAG: hypothetical protein Q7R32_10355 [Dehalococcoidia bacterium]|nr:hypothetical protein [Dehalococcoidia bacterium]